MFAALILGLSGCAYFLARIGQASWLPPPTRLLSAPPEEAIYGAVWLLAVAVTAWLGLTTILSVLAFSIRIPQAIRFTGRLTIAPLHRLAGRVAALVLTLSGLSVTTTAGAWAAPPIPYQVTVEQAEPTYLSNENSIEMNQSPKVSSRIPPAIRPNTVTGMPGPVATSPKETGSAPPVPYRSAPHSREPTFRLSENETLTYLVKPGDHLWSISAKYLAYRLGRRPSTSEVHTLWVEVVERNRSSISSGDPNLIFPGERIVLPNLDDP